MASAFHLSSSLFHHLINPLIRFNLLQLSPFDQRPFKGNPSLAALILFYFFPLSPPSLSIPRPLLMMKLSISAKCKMEQRWHHFHQITSDTDNRFPGAFPPLPPLIFPSNFPWADATPPCFFLHSVVFISSVATVLAIFISGRR